MGYIRDNSGACRAEKKLLGLDAREDFLGLLQEEQTRHIQIKGYIAHLASLEEVSWR